MGKCLPIVALLALAMGWAAPALSQPRWAAVDPNSDGSSPVAWGASETEARQRASEACKRLSRTCANGPAATADMTDVFAVVCCSKPRTGCAASAAATRREALHGLEKMFAEAGYSNCALKHYMSAASGKRQ